MNTARVISAAKEIETCNAALKWLGEFGPGLFDCDREHASITVHLSYAGSCVGAKEAQLMLSRFAQLEMASIVARTTENCWHTIRLNERIIREELGDLTTEGTW